MMIRVLIISGLFWIMALMVYHLILKKFTFHHLNRWYLLISLIIGAALPFVSFPKADQEATLIFYLNPVVIQLNEVATQVVAQAQSVSINYWYIIGVLYSLIVVFHLIKLLRGIHVLWKQTKKATIKKRQGVYVVYSSDIKQPFSFWKWIFIQDETSIDPIILDHEYAHIKGGHSWDKLILQFVAAFYWVIPVFIFYRKYINEIHEYIADGYVLQKTSKKKYSYFLLGQTGQGVTPLLSNNFHSLIKNRITMILKKKSNAYSRLWYLPVMILMLGLASVVLISCDNQKEESGEVQIDDSSEISKMVTLTDTIITFDPETYKETMKVVKSEVEVFNKLDQMPIFSLENCNDLDGKERSKCAMGNLVGFISENLKYPKNAKQEGIVVIKFIVDKYGYAVSPEIVKTIGEEYSQAVLTMFSKMDTHKWVPGAKDGENKAVYLELPIKFRLE